VLLFFFFSSRRRHTRFSRDWSSDVCSSDLFSELQRVLEKVTFGKRTDVPAGCLSAPGVLSYNPFFLRDYGALMAARRILLGITGGIAAYKSAELVRLLKKAGLEVRVVMTRGAEAFVTPLTFQALSGEPVRTSLLDPEAEAGMGHIELAKWADQVVVAPASADFLARFAQGMADDLLTTVCCATEVPIAVAP